jgi:predicted nuclease of predicted toxin-antitoxin system
LFDANLSPRLVGRLAVLFPGSAHVFEIGLDRFKTDEQIWTYAGTNGFTIVMADSDFLWLAESRGAPPKVIRLQNATTGHPGLKTCCAGTPF